MAIEQAGDQTQAATQARTGYDRMAHVYNDHVAQEFTGPSLVRSGLDFFAHLVEQSGAGPVVDVGCGPGHVTAYLADLGLDISGLDISPALIDIARTAHGDISFDLGELADLPFNDDSVRALVSRHSLIHTPAALVPQTLAEVARVMVPNGLLFLSFFAAFEPGRHGDAFDHAVTTAYQFDIDQIADLLDRVGLIEEVRLVRQPRPGERQLPHAVLFARRSPRPAS